MKGLRRLLILAPLLAGALPRQAPPRLAPIAVDYPLQDSLFPPDFAPPTFLFRDPSPAAHWAVEVHLPGVAAPLRAPTAGPRLTLGEIDSRAQGPTNRPPELTPEQAEAHAWRPDAALWDSLQKGALDGDAVVTFIGYAGEPHRDPLSRGEVRLRVSRDPAGAPVFYRDVPLMPSEPVRGVIKPLAPQVLPYVAWRLRWLDQPSSKVLLTGIHTCANCHSFSADGRTLGLDMDGPQNDKGLYALVPVARRVTVSDRDLISWRDFRGQMARDKRIGFMSQVSPDGRYVVTATEVDYYVANFKDYRFLQVFYPTRGILAWYDREARTIHPLPGADDPRYVHSNAVWSPDGSYLVFARAEARDAYPPGAKMAAFANDPNEPQVRYDLCRIPFNGGRGGKPEPVGGASANGASNSFPKVSPDGRWIVFVRARNGQLMRPDSTLWIVPAAGGTARKMRCNTPLMNSWHSFSPNGRWIVFSSKARSPYTQMYLTHIDEQGNDTPAILVENSTAANRAVNIPEFVSVARGGFESIEAPAAEFYRLYDEAIDLTAQGRVDAAIQAWTHALALDPSEPRAANNLAALLLRQGRAAEAESRFRAIIRDNPDFPNARENLALILVQQGKLDEAIAEYRAALDLSPGSTEAHANLGTAYLLRRRYADAVREWQAALDLEPNRLAVLGNLAWLLATCPEAAVRDGPRAVEVARRAISLAGESDPLFQDTLAAAYAESGQWDAALAGARKALDAAAGRNDAAHAAAIRTRIVLYQNRQPYREAP
jgi:tetratricopeptide (TPR) repeat protein